MFVVWARLQTTAVSMKGERCGITGSPVPPFKKERKKNPTREQTHFPSADCPNNGLRSVLQESKPTGGERGETRWGWRPTFAWPVRRRFSLQELLALHLPPRRGGARLRLPRVCGAREEGAAALPPRAGLTCRILAGERPSGGAEGAPAPLGKALWSCVKQRIRTPPVSCRDHSEASSSALLLG